MCSKNDTHNTQTDMESCSISHKLNGFHDNSKKTVNMILL